MASPTDKKKVRFNIPSINESIINAGKQSKLIMYPDQSLSNLDFPLMTQNESLLYSDLYTNSESSNTNPEDTLFENKWKEAISLYHGDENIIKDEKKAFEVFYDLANKGHRPSMLELGCMYFMGAGIDKSISNAKLWWKKLIPDPEALYGLGLIYYFGNEEENLLVDHEKAQKCWKASAYGNNFNAYECLEKYFPFWNPENVSPSTPKSNVYFDDETLLFSPEAKQTTHFYTPDFSPDNKQIKDINSTARRSSSLIHNLSTYKTSPSNNQRKEINEQTKYSKFFKENRSNIFHINQTMNLVNNQLIDVQASVNVLNNHMIKESAFLQNGISEIKGNIEDIYKNIQFLDNNSKNINEIHTLSTKHLNDEVSNISRRMDILETKLSASLSLQKEIKQLLLKSIGS